MLTSVVKACGSADTANNAIVGKYANYAAFKESAVSFKLVIVRVFFVPILKLLLIINS